MKYSEFKAIAKENGWEFDIDEGPKGYAYVSKDDFVIAIGKSTQNYMNLHAVRAGQGGGIELSEEKSFIKACYELVETPIEDREDEKEYYLKHLFINTKDGSNYLNMSIANGELLLTDGHPDPWNVYKARFTESEIEEIEDEGFDLRNFKKIEVEDE